MAIELISKIKPKNNGSFALVDAHDVDVDGTRLDELLSRSGTVVHYSKLIGDVLYIWDETNNDWLNTGITVGGGIGEDGNGIESVVFNDNYTLSFVFTDGTMYTTPSIRGEQGISIKGDKGDKGEPPTLSVGSVNTTSAETNADVWITDGIETTYELNFSIPRGIDGEGSVASISYEEIDNITNTISGDSGDIFPISHGDIDDIFDIIPTVGIKNIFATESDIVVYYINGEYRCIISAISDKVVEDIGNGILVSEEESDVDYVNYDIVDELPQNVIVRDVYSNVDSSVIAYYTNGSYQYIVAPISDSEIYNICGVPFDSDFEDFEYNDNSNIGINYIPSIIVQDISTYNDDIVVYYTNGYSKSIMSSISQDEIYTLFSDISDSPIDFVGVRDIECDDNGIVIYYTNGDSRSLVSFINNDKIDDLVGNTPEGQYAAIDAVQDISINNNSMTINYTDGTSKNIDFVYRLA